MTLTKVRRLSEQVQDSGLKFVSSVLSGVGWKASITDCHWQSYWTSPVYQSSPRCTNSVTYKVCQLNRMNHTHRKQILHEKPGLFPVCWVCCVFNLSEKIIYFLCIFKYVLYASVEFWNVSLKVLKKCLMCIFSILFEEELVSQCCSLLT